MITIFTPTYNRAHTLPKLYESLKHQTGKNFEWLIVDDGSTDSTRELIASFQQENPFPIRYIKQENQGKHVAFNRGIKEAKGSYFTNIDSDDFLLPDAVSMFYILIDEIRDKPYSGFTFIHFSNSKKYNPDHYGNKRWNKGEPYQWEFWGEMQYCIKREILAQFPFPVFPGENFCPESLILRRLEQKYNILYTDCVLAKGDYLEEGLTRQYYKLLLANPHGSLLNYKERMKNEPHLRKSLTQQYLDIAFKAKGVSVREKWLTVNPLDLFSFLANKFQK